MKKAQVLPFIILDQLLKAKFKYFDKCDRIFAYIKKDEGEDDDNGTTLDNSNSIYY